MSVRIAGAFHFEAKKMLGIMVKVNAHVEIVLKTLFKGRFNAGVFRKIQEIVNVKTNIEWGVTGKKNASEEARGICTRGEAQSFKRGCSLVKPVFRAALETVESTLEKKVCAGWGDGAARRRSTNILFVGW